MERERDSSGRVNLLGRGNVKWSWTPTGGDRHGPTTSNQNHPATPLARNRRRGAAPDPIFKPLCPRQPSFLSRGQIVTGQVSERGLAWLFANCGRHKQVCSRPCSSSDGPYGSVPPVTSTNGAVDPVGRSAAPVWAKYIWDPIRNFLGFL